MAFGCALINGKALAFIIYAGFCLELYVLANADINVNMTW